MNPSIITILLHIGGILKTVKDVEQSISDIVKKQSPKEDIQRVIEDIVSLVSSGVISIPGVTPEQLSEVLKELETAI